VARLTSEDLSSAICFFRLLSSILAEICTATAQRHTSQRIGSRRWQRIVEGVRQDVQGQ